MDRMMKMSDSDQMLTRFVLKIADKLQIHSDKYSPMSLMVLLITFKRPSNEEIKPKS